MPEPIEMLFGLWAWMRPRNMYGVQITPWEGAFFGKRGLSAKSCAKTAESRYFFGMLSRLTHLKLDGVQIPHAKGQFWGKGHVRACPPTLCHELCKNGWTNRSAVWVMDSGGRWTQGSTCMVGLYGVQMPMQSSNFSRNSTLWHARRHSLVSRTKVIESIELRI